MTITNATRLVLAGGNGATTEWPFAFLIPTAEELVVTTYDEFGVPTVQDASAYSVVGINSPTGGTVTYPLVGDPLAVGEQIVIERRVSFVQPTSFANQQRFFPTVLEAALDRLVMQTQQLAEILSRAPTLPPTASTTEIDELYNAILVANENITAILAVNSDLAVINSVNANGANITAVANISAAVTSVAQKYQGAAADNPTVRTLDGSALQVGDFYLNTVSGDIRFVTSIGPVVWAELATLIDESTLLAMGVTSSAADLNALIPLGVPFPVWDHITGIPVPSNAGDSKFIKLTAGLTGAGQYNEGLLGSESVSGSAPSITATASILVGPAVGQTVPLINTEDAFLRARTTSGTLQAQSTQDHKHRNSMGFDDGLFYGWLDGTNQPFFGSEVISNVGRSTVALAPAGGQPVIIALTDLMQNLSGETRPHNRSASYYMRIA